MINKEDCKIGNHSLIVIYTNYRGQDEVEVVRWCKECGSIVVDIDCDGRTYPGAITKMKIPKSLSDQKVDNAKEEEIMKEIERKFLVKDVPENLNSYPNNRYVQHYISLNPEIRIRSIDDEVFKITVKSDGDLIREEFETNIDEQTFRKMEQISLGKISKTRYKIGDFEVDFYDDFKDLITVEIEFDNEEDSENFIKPDWIGEEITYDKAYKNKNLAKRNQ